MSALTIFNNQIENFIKDLQTIFPANNDLTVGYEKFKLLREMNARKIHSLFMKHIYKHRQNIMIRDEDFFLKNMESLAAEEDPSGESFKKLFNLSKLWNDLSAKNKEAIWKYLQVLIVLAEKAL